MFASSNKLFQGPQVTVRLLFASDVLSLDITALMISKLSLLQCVRWMCWLGQRIYKSET